MEEKYMETNENEIAGDSKEDIPVTEQVIIDDSEDDAASLDKNIEKDNVFRDKEIKDKNDKIEKIKGAVFKGFLILSIVVALFFVFAVIRSIVFRPVDDKSFILDNPEDPLSYSNVAMSIDEADIIPIYKFSVQGTYQAFDSEDIYSEHTFNFDPSGYFEGHSSKQEDDYGVWDMTSDGDNYYVVVTCTDVEDKYKLEITDDNIIMLTQSGKTYTLTPIEE